MVDFRVDGIASMDPDELIRSAEEVLAKFDELKGSADELDVKLDEISHKGVTVEVNINGEDKLTRLELLLDKMDSVKKLNIDVNVDGEDKIAALDAMLDDLDTKAKDVAVKVNVDGAADSIAKLEALDKELDNKQKDLKKTTDATNGFKFSWMLLLPLLTAAVPVLLSAAGGLGALGSAALTMAPGLLGVFAAVKSNITGLTNMESGLSQSAAAALDAADSYKQIYNVLQKNSTAFQQMDAMTKNLAVNYELMKKSYENFVDAVNPTVIPMMLSGFSLLDRILGGLPSVVNPAATAIKGFLDDFSKRLGNPVFQSFFKDMQGSMGTLVTNFLTGILNIIQGLAALADAFMPLGVTVSGGFERMTKSFMLWAQSLKTSKGFQEFVEYVKREGPIVLHVIGQLVELIAKIVGALTGMGGGALSVIDKIVTGLNHFADTNPGLFKVAVNLGVLGVAASKLAPLLGPLIAFLATPVGAIVGSIVALAVGFVVLYEKSKTFHDWVDKNLLPMWDQIVTAAKGFESWAKSIWPEIHQIWQKYGANIMAVVKSDFETITAIITGAMKIIQGIIDVVLGILNGKWGQVWKGLTEIVSGAWRIIWGLVQDGTAIVNNIISVAFKVMTNLANSANQELEKIFHTMMTDIGHAIKGGWDTVTRDTKQWGSDLWDAVTSAWNTVVSWVEGVPGKITNALGDLGSLLYNAGTKVIQGLVDGIKHAASTVLSSALNWVTSIIPSWKGPASKDATLLYDNGTLIMQGLIDGLDSKHTALKNSLTGFTKTISTAFGEQYTTDISAQISAKMAQGNFSMVGMAQSPANSGLRGNSVTFAEGAIQVNAPTTPEAPSQTLSKTMQAVARFGLVQAPMGVEVPR